MALVAVIRPAEDADARTMAVWGADAARLVAVCGHSLHLDLHGVAVTRAQATTALKSCSAVLFFGHGKRSELMNGSTSLIDDMNVGQGSVHVIVAIACWSADALGPHAQTQGVQGYLGFRDQFAFLSGDPHGQFGLAAVRCVESLMRGAPLGDAERMLKSKLQDVVDYYKTGAGSRDPNAAVGWLTAFFDKSNVKRIGPQSVTL